MQVGALTGARLNAIINMRVDHAAGPQGGGTITFPPQKKELGPRTIPLHSHLREALADFQGWPWTGSSTVSGLFGLYRRKVFGPDPGGRRRAQTNYHS
jgi:integrase